MIKEIYWDFCLEANIEPNIEEDIKRTMDWWLMQASYYEAAESPQWGQEREARAGLANAFTDFLVDIVKVYGITTKTLVLFSELEEQRGGLCDGKWYMKQFQLVADTMENCRAWGITV